MDINQGEILIKNKIFVWFLKCLFFTHCLLFARREKKKKKGNNGKLDNTLTERSKLTSPMREKNPHSSIGNALKSKHYHLPGTLAENAFNFT